MNTQEWRVTHKRIKRNRPDGSKEVYVEGDEFVPTDKEIQAFRDRLEPVLVRTIIQQVEDQLKSETSTQDSSEASAPNTDPEVPEETPEEFDPAKLNVDEVLEKVATGEVSAQDVYYAEVEGKNRSTLLEQLGPYL